MCCILHEVNTSFNFILYFQKDSFKYSQCIIQLYMVYDLYMVYHCAVYLKLP